MLSKEYRKLLIQIKKGKVIRTCLENKDLDYLYDLKYIEMITVPNPDDPFVQPYLTDKGKAYLEEYRKTRINNILSMGIAIVGVIAAILALR